MTGTTHSIPRTVFSLDDCGTEDRYSVWRESIACIFDVDVDRDTRREAFTAEIDAKNLGTLLVGQTRTVAQSWQRTASTIARDGMDHYMIQIYRQGRVRWSEGTQDHELAENDLIVYDLSREIATATTDMTNISLILPRGVLQDQIAAPDDQHMRVLSSREPMVALLRDHLVSLDRQAPRMTVQQGLEAGQVTTALTAACLNGAAGDTRASRRGMAVAQMIRIRRHIEANLADPAMTAASIARACGVSRSKLYQIFEPFDGVGAYVRDLRLRRALRLLAATDASAMPISEVALSCGYQNFAAFSRAFKDRFGVQPRDARSMSRDGHQRDIALLPVDRRYEEWLTYLTF